MPQGFKMLVLALHVFILTPMVAIASTWWDRSEEGPTCFEKGTCNENDKTCECILTIEHRLTMMTSPDPILVWPKNGSLYSFDDIAGTHPLPKHRIENTITADGVGSRMVITINGLFPGPSIVAFEGQDVIIHVRNRMQTDSTSIHWHGIHQMNSVDSDGVAFITQCPILPGQNFTYSFKAEPKGTHFYHSQIGNQRSMGLYGALIIIPKAEKVNPEQHNGFTVLLQDWNHNDDPETSYLRMLNGLYDLKTRKLINATYSVDGTKFGQFQFHSGLINGMGRYYETRYKSNEAPLHVFEVEESKIYLFRVISAATLYPFRVYIDRHPHLTIKESDGHEIVKNLGTAVRDLVVESFIIHPGERFDFSVQADQEPGSYLLVAESLEVLDTSKNEYHAAEAIVHYAGTPIISNPLKANPNVCKPHRCLTFNCPFRYYPLDTHRQCWTFDNETYSRESTPNYKEVYNVSKTLYFNFGFPENHGFEKGSVSGRQFVFPTEPILYKFDKIEASCQIANCGVDNVCQCTYFEQLHKDMVYQLVLSNIGDGQGWSHPIHLHGNHFYVVKMGFGSYDIRTAKLLQETNDIRCTGKSKPNLCNSEIWKTKAWVDNPNSISGIKLFHPPKKDTIIVPSGGYVIIRFKAKNPGTWFLHSQVNFHTTHGIGMILFVGNQADYPKSKNPHACWKVKDDNGMDCSTTVAEDKVMDALIVVLSILGITIVVFVIFFCYCIILKKKCTLCKRIFRSSDGERRPLITSNSTSDLTSSYSSYQSTINSRDLLGGNEHQTKAEELSNVA